MKRTNKVASTAGSMSEAELEEELVEFGVQSPVRIQAMFNHYVLGKSKRSSALEAGMRPDNFFVLCKRFNQR